MQDFPLISILMATYNPNLEWFILQLQSINEQDYPNLELIVIDDCSNILSIEIISDLVECYTTNISHKLYQNSFNMGSNKTFERLTEMAEGDYFAYCDQDDIWEIDKLSQSMWIAQSLDATLVCGDVKVINGRGKTVADSISDVRKRCIINGDGSSKDVYKRLLTRNFVIGCTALVKREIAQAAIPFPAIETGIIHDHWIALFAANKGRIGVYAGNLVSYRIHGNNQTGVLSKINTKYDYYKLRILPFRRQIEQISERLDVPIDIIKWTNARVSWFKQGKFSAFFTICKYIKINSHTSKFELALKFMTKSYFGKILEKIKSGQI